MKKSKKAPRTLQRKMSLAFLGTMLLIFIVNMFMYRNINEVVKRMDAVYQENVNLNRINDALTDVQESMQLYLQTRTTDAMEEYYRNEQIYAGLVEQLSENISDDPLDTMERNIKHMSESYLEMTNQTIEAKRGRNIVKYKERSEKAGELYGYISACLYSLNNDQFRNNSTNYEVLAVSLHSLEVISTVILAAAMIGNVLLIMITAKTLTSPLKELAATANEVAQGNFDVEPLQVCTDDEIGVVTNAFNKMITSLRSYISGLKSSMERERALKEKDLLMQTHLKDAQLKYLQAQINPHFLFNSLNAGAQLAMMEEAERTYQYIQNMADFFRYNLKKNNAVVSLREEIELVDSYVYIINVRFSGEIHFEKRVEERFGNVSVPSMILQPIVENSINYGIRNIEWEGMIVLAVYQFEDSICISIRDNGIGMSQEKIDRVMQGGLRETDLGDDSNGVGLDNVIGRLRLFYDSEDVLEIISEGENKGTEVRIYLPLPGGEYLDV